jgi:biopolymer transport protein ExbD
MSSRFRDRRNRNSSNQLPEVNLVPMMDVLMTVLTFFIIVSMTLNGQQISGVILPKTNGQGLGKESGKPPAKLLVGLTNLNQIRLGSQQVVTAELVTEIQSFLGQNPDGKIILKADRSLNYKQVSTLLKTMRDVGGDRVSLSITKTNQ